MLRSRSALLGSAIVAALLANYWVLEDLLADRHNFDASWISDLSTRSESSGGTFVALGVLAWVFFEVAREGTEKQDLLDLARERGVELDERRAQRAVAAGHGALLEERLTAAGDD